MSYSRSEYHKEETDRNQDGGWRSWFGLGSNKDRDDDRGYSYARTTTYRDDQPRSGQYSSGDYNRPSYSSQQYGGDRDRSFGVSGGVSTYGGSGERGGYGYQTTGEASSRYQGPYSSQPQYGQQYGQSSDRDCNRDQGYYRSETRTYGGDRETPRYGGDMQRYGGDNTRQSYSTSDRSPSRSYGFSGDYNTSSSSSQYPRGGQGQDYSYSRTTTTGGDRDRSYGDRETSRYGFSGDNNTSSSSRYGGPTGGYSTSYRY